MSETGRSPLARLVSEFGVIVIGVLVALLAESAWHERGERKEEAETLGWIAADLAEDSASLAIDRAWIDLVVPAALEARDVLSGRDTLAPPARLAVLYAASTIRSDAMLTRTWDDLVASGRVSLIRDADLRRGLIDFYGRLAATRSSQESLPTDFRTAIIASLPTDFTRGVLTECVRNGAGTGPRSDAATALRACTVEPGEDPMALLDRLRAVPGIDRALGELTYDLTGTAEHLDGAEASFTRLRLRLETIRGVR